MKNLKTIIAMLSISLLSTFSVAAFDGEPKTTNEKIREKMVNLIGNKIQMEITEDQLVEISFMFNKNNEVVILSINDDNSKLDKLVKNKLNYKTIDVKGIKKGEIYRLPLKLKKM